MTTDQSERCSSGGNHQTHVFYYPSSYITTVLERSVCILFISLSHVRREIFPTTIKKWSQREHDFLQYLENEWLNTPVSWYEGYNYFASSTNNSLETINRMLKDEHTLRERHLLSRFLCNS